MKKAGNLEFWQRLKELGVLETKKIEELEKIIGKNEEWIGDVVYEKDWLTDEQIGQIVADLYELPFVDLNTVVISEEMLAELPEVFCRKQQVLAYKKDKNGLWLVTANPDNLLAIDFVAKKTGEPVKVAVVTKRAFDIFWEKRESKIGTSFEAEVKKIVEAVEKGTVDDSPIIRLVELIMNYAQTNGVSDVHLEPQEKQLIVRFRIDSVLNDVAILPISIHEQVVTRIKVMSQLRTDEHMAAQDGKFQFESREEKIDVRVSITPVVTGEKVVMRLLSSKTRQFSLTTLGLADDDLKKVEEAYKKPFGMILVTGPTGSGKTTTLYSILKLLNNREVNIMTIEDPVEYEVAGVNQIQVNTATNLNFAQGLRSIVRQDPNIILVGEIRDAETAQIATNAAMTGHLVLSTLHTNDAATAIPRLFDMGVEPFIIASSVNCIVAQRLVRKICLKCRTSKEIAGSELKNLGIKTDLGEKVRVYYGKGCDVCHQSGYNGRVGIFEVMVVGGKVREAVASKKTVEEINKQAISEGMKTMMDDGVLKILSGETTLEEVLRVTRI